MRQLSEHDAGFIYSDSEHANSNVTLLHIYDQSTVPGGVVRFRSIVSHVESRLDRLPLFRQKIRRVPFDLDYPYWIEDENFDIEFHVRHLALPKPGDWRQFCIQASRIHARSLDLHRPLWEMYVIEGLDSFLDLPPGSFAVLLKIHHAAIDVEHGNEITTLLHDLSPSPGPISPPQPWFPDSPPSDLNLVLRAAGNAATFPLRATRTAWLAVTMIGNAMRTFFNEFLHRPAELPTTRFNTEVSPYRVFETRRFALEEFKAIRGLVAGATVNDVVLAVCAGGLRKYLDRECELPEESLVAAAPITVREMRQGDGEPSFSWVPVALGTDIADPVERLAKIHATTTASDTMDKAVSARELTEMTNHAPAMALAVTTKMLRSASVQLGGWAPLANCAIINVPGPRQPLYLRGAQLTYFSAILPVTDGMGLVFSVTSYRDMVVVSFTACSEQLPDPAVFAQCIRDSFQEYLAIARPSPAGRRKPRLVAVKGGKADAAAKPKAGAKDKPARTPRTRQGRLAGIGPRPV